MRFFAILLLCIAPCFAQRRTFIEFKSNDCLPVAISRGLQLRAEGKKPFIVRFSNRDYSIGHAVCTLDPERETDSRYAIKEVCEDFGIVSASAGTWDGSGSTNFEKIKRIRDRLLPGAAIFSTGSRAPCEILMKLKQRGDWQAWVYDGAGSRYACALFQHEANLLAWPDLVLREGK